MVRKKAIRRITAPVRAKINNLVLIVREFLPLTSPSPQTTTFSKIFKESRANSYFGKETNKSQALQNGFENLFRYHSRLLHGIIRKVILAAIEYRRHKRNPLKRTELDQLAECLYDLGVDMRKEIRKIPLDESLPRITVPPDKLLERLEKHDLVPEISSEPLELFRNGHFNEAVRKAAERYESKVQEVSAETRIGKDLMTHAFRDITHVKIDGIKENNVNSFNEGFKFLSMGMMGAVRNIFSHGDEENRAPEECFEMLLFLNWLFRYVK